MTGTTSATEAARTSGMARQLALSLRGASESREIEKHRKAYVKLRQSVNDRARRALAAELDTIDKRVAQAHQRIAANAQQHVAYLGWLKHEPFDAQSAEAIAADEFDRLARVPAVSAIHSCPDHEWLRVTVEPASGTSAEGEGGAMSPSFVSVGLKKPYVLVDGAEWMPTPLSSLGERSFRVRSRMLAAELIGAGVLPELLGEVLPDMTSRLQASAKHISTTARDDYIRSRTAALLACDFGVELQKSERAIRVEMGNLNDLARRACMISRALEVVDRAPHHDDGSLAREYDELSAHPGITGIKVARSVVVVSTVPVVLKSSSGTRHLIGRFEVEIRPGKGVAMHNVSGPPAGPRGQTDHPHIRAGNCCLGNIQSLMSRLLLTDDLRALISLSVEYLFSLNEASTFASVTCWPVVNESGEVVGGHGGCDPRP